jgi:hypothetical protein
VILPLTWCLTKLNYFEGIELTDDMFMQDTLNDFISDGQKHGVWSESNCRTFDAQNLNYKIMQKI